MTIRSRLLGAVAAAALLMPVAAKADTHDGFYLGAGVGMGFAGDSEFESGATTNDVELNGGFAGFLTGGYQFSNNWRVQAEFGMRQNDVDEITGAGAAAPFDGDINVYSLMADAIYGIPTGTKFTPYIGAGAGLAWVNADSVATVLGTTVDDNDTAFAYQGIAGIEYDVTDNLKADLAYRYFRTADLEFDSAVPSTVDANYENHTITLGLRYLIPVAKAMPAPVAAAAPESAPAQPMVPNNYIVFFDFDRATLSPEAERIVTAAAQNANQAKVTTIEVSGHADRSGSDRYNMRLSQRRADVVKNSLVAMGIPADQIALTARGESDPLVATADGVREAQNRRVQIVLK
jgi:outer membrane protein OmpA-like peptidoglycan-associated protein